MAGGGFKADREMMHAAHGSEFQDRMDTNGVSAPKRWRVDPASRPMVFQGGNPGLQTSESSIAFAQGWGLVPQKDKDGVQFAEKYY